MAGKKRIAVFSIDAKLGDEVRGATRYTFLCELLARAGYEVDFITSRFQHWDKRFRDTTTFDAGTDSFAVRFIEEPGYPKNICPQRIWSHHIAAKSARAYFDEHHDYDLIYCQIPPNDVAREIGRAAKRYGIPFVVDVNDLWPEAFRVALDIPVVSDVLFWPLYRQARAAYDLADAIVGTSDEYASRAFADRPHDIPSITVYVGNDLSAFDAGARAHAAEVVKPEGEVWIIYAGTLSACYDLVTLVRAVASAQKADPRIKLKLMGDGAARPEIERAVAETGCDAELVGYMPYDVMAAWLCASDITVNSLVGKAAQSIVTKIGDYLAAGIPMVNTSKSAEFSAKVEADGFGVNVEPQSPDALASALLELVAAPDARMQMGVRARAVAEEQFDRPHAYRKTVELIERLIEER